MDFHLTDEQEMLREGVGRFVQENYGFEVRRAVAASELAFSAAQWQHFADLGWLALTLPEDAGGLGCTAIESSLVTEQLGSALVLEPYATTAVFAARILEQAADASLRLKSLGAIGEGRLRVAVAHAEPGARYDLGRVAAMARRDGAGYRISGAKILVPHAPSAHQLIISARLDEGAGFGLFLIDAGAPGVRMRSYRLLDATPAADLELSDVRVDSAALLIDSAHGLRVLEEATDRLLLAQVAYALGAMQSVLDISAEYTKSRVQFGQPLFKFQATQHRLAEMFVEVQEVRSILYCGLAHLDAERATRRRMVSAAKAVTAQAGRLVGGLGIQLHGGIGMTEEYRVGHYFKHLVVFEKLNGDTDYHLAQVAGVESTSVPEQPRAAEQLRVPERPRVA
ncbi:MAG: acyl-CoA dehydrogenase family protein [Steroidobacteraceae bacterium]